MHLTSTRPSRNVCLVTDDSTPDQEAPGWWLWPVKWITDQSFWRDVTSRALSGLIVAAVAYLFAILAGYLSAPGPLHVVLIIAALIASFMAGLLTVVAMWPLIGVVSRWLDHAWWWARLLVLVPLANVPGVVFLFALVWLVRLIR